MAVKKIKKCTFSLLLQNKLLTLRRNTPVLGVRIENV